MIYCLNDEFIENVGNKAQKLKEIYSKGFCVPNFIVLTNESLVKIEENDENEIESVFRFLKEEGKYAIRSSGINEDLDNKSFAGMYESYLNVSGREKIIQAIKDCYNARNSEKIIGYCTANGIDIKNLEMAVIVQEMVEAKVSLIAFSVNVITGKDTEIIIEAIDGLGDKNASGEVVPKRYIYDWYNDEIKLAEDTLLTEVKIKEISNIVLEIQQLYGYPVDLEIVIDYEKIWILQVRPITKILHSAIKEQWTTANFKDGGVSATVCYPLLWSLYENVYDKVAREFFLDVKVYKESEITKQIDYFYCRPYWNVTACKTALCKLPGFIEKDYDNELGVQKYYDGDGRTSNLNMKDWMNALVIIKNYLRITKEQKDILQEFYDSRKIQFNEYYAADVENMSFESVKKIWKKLIQEDYLKVETTYFWQVFINIVKQTLFKKKMLKYFNYTEYLNFISGIKNISHTKPIKKQIEILNQIRDDKEEYSYWTTNDILKILEDYKNNVERNGFKLIKKYIDEFGYHSDRELDITYKCHYEDVEGIISKFKNNLSNEEFLSITDFEESSYLKYEEQLRSIRNKKLKKNIEEMREFLWWREELKDLSIRYYCLVRKYTNKLAEMFKSNNIIKNKFDIYFLKKNDISEFIDNKITIEALNDKIAKNKKYYYSFKNFENPTDIGEVYGESSQEYKEYLSAVNGIGCSDKIVEGRVKVIENLADIDMIKQDDILVTKFIDTGWTSRFAILKGVISEYGGVLCHSSIVAREYGLSTIVGAKDACSKLKTGNIIQMNGQTGEIKILKECE